MEELYDGEDIGTCPSCTLRIRIIFDEDNLPALKESTDCDEESEGDKKLKSDSVSKDVNDVDVSQLTISEAVAVEA